MQRRATSFIHEKTGTLLGKNPAIPSFCKGTLLDKRRDCASLVFVRPEGSPSVIGPVYSLQIAIFLYHFFSGMFAYQLSTAKCGFHTFREPILSEWLAFHLKNSQLQELTHEQHVKKTNERRMKNVQPHVQNMHTETLVQ